MKELVNELMESFVIVDDRIRWEYDDETNRLKLIHASALNGRTGTALDLSGLNFENPKILRGIVRSYLASATKTFIEEVAHRNIGYWNWNEDE